MAPLSSRNFQIYKKWRSPVFGFSKSMVYWGYKINRIKNFVRFLFYEYRKFVTSYSKKKTQKLMKIEKLLNETV